MHTCIQCQIIKVKKVTLYLPYTFVLYTTVCIVSYFLAWHKPNAQARQINHLFDTYCGTRTTATKAVKFINLYKC